MQITLANLMLSFSRRHIRPINWKLDRAENLVFILHKRARAYLLIQRSSFCHFYGTIYVFSLRWHSARYPARESATQHHEVNRIKHNSIATWRGTSSSFSASFHAALAAARRKAARISSSASWGLSFSSSIFSSQRSDGSSLLNAAKSLLRLSYSRRGI